jgi:hypothetical protein
MRVVAALALGLVVLVVPALAGEPAPYVRTCASSAYGDLGQGWRERAVVAGHVAFVGMRNGLSAARAPHKVLVVVDPNAAPTVTIAIRSRAYAALGYNGIRHSGGRVPLAHGTLSVRFQACRAVRSREPWNRGTQFPGYFLVDGARCVHVDVATQGRVLRRKLSFGARCV